MIIPYAETPAEPLIRSGAADLAISYPPQVIISRSDGLKYKAVAALVAGNTTGLAVLASSPVDAPGAAQRLLYGGFGLTSDRPVIETIMRNDGVSHPSFHEVVLNTGVTQALGSHRIGYTAVFEGIDDVTAALQGVKLRTFPYRDYLGAAGQFPNSVFVASDAGDRTPRVRPCAGRSPRSPPATNSRRAPSGGRRAHPDRRKPDRARQQSAHRQGDRRRHGAALSRRRRPVGADRRVVVHGARVDPRQGRPRAGPRAKQRRTADELAAAGTLMRDDDVERLLAAARIAPRSAGESAVIAIDGRAGAGKSTLAALLARELSVPVVEMDLLYGGWDGLERGMSRLVDDVLAPLAASGRARVPRYDWHAARWGEPAELARPALVIVEGVGAGAVLAAPYTALLVWLELEEAERKRRAVARDGRQLAEHWEMWAAQEELYLARALTPERADLVIDTGESAFCLQPA